jgi:hypothetical protein
MTGDGGTHLTADDLVLLHFGECADQACAEAHLAACAMCRGELERLGTLLAVIASNAEAEAPPGFERVRWARLEPHVRRVPRVGWLEWIAPRRLAFAAGAASLVLAAFLAGRWSTPPASPALTSGVAEIADGAPERVLLGAAGEHLDRSQRVLVELLNGEPTTRMAASERERAADLVAASRLIRQSAADAGETALADVLGDLERVLMELANGSDRDPAAELRLLRERIEARGILFRMRVVGSDVREREKVGGPPVS